MRWRKDEKEEEVGEEKISHICITFDILQTALCVWLFYKQLYVYYLTTSISQLHKEGKMRPEEVKLLARATQLLNSRAKAQTRPPAPVKLIFHSHKLIHLEANLSPCPDLRHPVLHVTWEGQSSRPDPASCWRELFPWPTLFHPWPSRCPEHEDIFVDALAECPSVAADDSTRVPDVCHRPGQISVPL